MVAALRHPNAIEFSVSSASGTLTLTPNPNPSPSPTPNQVSSASGEAPPTSGQWEAILNRL